ncbi:unnamed protein product [Cyberlindnera jadinii]|uniref:Uncharacterized protein n=1 Tax=Cyberlindnera jadinii (strain ATCC 18201 / CBS 1600 / BCRC 20928 / JCM 3617 / NBRC 0987 / NRRL Y-1542) TaxID=983966 RepID=A0A0H5C188_CYBJN|nr:unnamed protein product [Cyberlindnera jadinii]
MRYLVVLWLVLVELCNAQTTTSWSPEELSSATSRALASDASFIYDVMLDINHRYTTYLQYMDSNKMQFPDDIVQYMVGLQTISKESSLFEAVNTMSFPFDDFKTMITAFPWYSSLMSAADLSTFLVPSDFLVIDAKVTTSNTIAEETGSTTEPRGDSTSEPSSDTTSTSNSSSSSLNGANSALLIPLSLVSIFLALI